MEPKDMSEDPKQLLKEAKQKLKQSITQKKVLQFTSSKKIVGVDFWNTISKLDTGDVVFTLNEPTHFRLTEVEFDGPTYREESHEDGKKVTKKKRHGLAGAAIGTVLMPGVGTIAGAMVGNKNGKDKGTSSSHTTTTQIEEATNIRLILENTETHESAIVGVLGKQTDYQELLNFKAPAAIIADTPTQEAPVTPETANDSTSLSDEIAELRKLKELVDEGILTQEEFDAKKKLVLGI